MSVFVPDIGTEVNVLDEGPGVVQSVNGTNIEILLESGETTTVHMENLIGGVPYLIFPCDDCEQDIVLDIRLDPGQATTIKCDNCGESWTVVQPSLEVYRTSKYEPIWRHIAQ